MTDSQPGVTTKGSSADSSAISTAELLGFIAYFGDTFLQKVGDSRRYTEMQVGRNEYRKPSMSLIGELAKHGNLSTATPKERTLLEKLTSRVFKGGAPIRSSWLRSLGTAMSMSETQIGLMCQRFSEKSTGPRIGDYTDTEQVKEAIRHYEKVAARNRKRNEVTRLHQAWAEDKSKELNLYHACLTGIEHLTVAPQGYPSSLDVTRLAMLLPGVSLTQGWEKKYQKIQRLYSGIDVVGEGSVVDLLRSSRRAVLLGDPGHGKSTALIAAAAAEAAAGKLVLFAYFEHLDDVAALSMARQAVLPSQWTTEWAANVLVEAAMASGLRLAPALRNVAVQSILTNRNVHIALDGWDEIKSDKSAAARVVELLGETPGSLVVTSRITGYSKFLTGADEALVCPMLPEQAQRFFEARLVDRHGARSRVGTALKNPMIASMARVPVLANFIAFVAETDKPSESVHGLYQQYVNLFLERSWRRSSTNSSITADTVGRIRRHLIAASEVAWFMATQPADPASRRVNNWADFMNLTELMAVPLGEVQCGVEELAFSDGLLVPHGIIRLTGLMDQEYRWIHRTIQEHLVARKLLQMARSNHPDWREHLRNAVLRRTWDETLRHFFGLMKDAGLLHLAIEEIRRFQQEGDGLPPRLTLLLGAITDGGNNAASRQAHHTRDRNDAADAAFQVEDKTVEKLVSSARHGADKDYRIESEDDVRKLTKLLHEDICHPNLEIIVDTLRSAAAVQGINVHEILHEAVERHGRSGEFVMAWFDTGRIEQIQEAGHSLLKFLLQGEAPPMLAYLAGVYLGGRSEMVSKMSPWACAGYVSNLSRRHELDRKITLEEARKAFDRVANFLPDRPDQTQPDLIRNFWLSIRLLSQNNDESRLNKMLILLFECLSSNHHAWLLGGLVRSKTIFSKSYRWPQLRTSFEGICAYQYPDFGQVAWEMVQLCTPKEELPQAAYEYAGLYLRTTNAPIGALWMHNPAVAVAALEAVYDAADDALSSGQVQPGALLELLRRADVELDYSDLRPAFWARVVRLRRHFDANHVEVGSVL